MTPLLRFALAISWSVLVVDGSSLLTSSSSQSLRFLQREEDHANSPCNVHDLADACPDDSIVEAGLIDMCGELHSVYGAKCYMVCTLIC